MGFGVGWAQGSMYQVGAICPIGRGNFEDISCHVVKYKEHLVCVFGNSSAAFCSQYCSSLFFCRNSYLPKITFLPRDAVLAWYLLSSCVRLCLLVRLSITSQYCIETTGRIQLIFGMEGLEASFHIRKFGYLES